MAKPAKQLVSAGTQVNHKTALMQVLAIDFAQDGPTTSGKHAERLPRQFVDDGLFDIAERRFTLALEKCPDGAAEPLFDDVVGVSEGKPEPAGQLTSDRGFSRSRKAN